MYVFLDAVKTFRLGVVLSGSMGMSGWSEV